MNTVLFVVGLVALAATALVMLALKRAKQLALEEAEEHGRQEVQEDVRLSDVSAANDIRERVSDVLVRLPATDAGGTAKPERRGRRGPV